ncbi:ATP-dependent Lon protease [Alkalihalophilus pseudofirmus]|uniref:ATP-dependent Lon protease n=1 Tax=Alkalihalophilus pseudofirmus TaxID=79885 RepID=UPI00259BEC79|nr:ATP-dependent Lon protease [Alkalihalophilus pseudofirmus]WEG18901.1 ATP-dependent Lon protease [Alkalihalophilus pseudofirmus]
MFMKLFLSIIIAGLLGILVTMGPMGIYLLCAIIVGVIFRSFVLLNDIHKQVVPMGNRDRVQEAYDKYVQEKQANGNPN